MTQYVRVRVPRDGAEDIAHTTSIIRAEAEGWEVLPDEPTHDSSGLVLEDSRLNGRPLKPRTSVDQASAEKAATSAGNTDNPPSTKE